MKFLLNYCISYLLDLLEVFYKKYLIDIDRSVLYCTFGLMFFGLIISLSVAPAISGRLGITTYHFFTKQVFFTGIAGVLIMYISRVPIEKLLFYANIFAVILIMCLMLVLFVGANIKGSKRWMDIGLFAIQPSEILKPFFVILNAKILARAGGENWQISVVKSIVFTGFIVCLLLLEPDFGMTVIYVFTSGIQMFVAGIPLRVLKNMGIIFILLCICAFLTFPHIRNRISGFTGSAGDIELNYQVKKAMQSIQEGGFLGKGPGGGVVKYQLPDSHTDFVFAVICEEFGYLVASIVLCIYSYIILRNLILISRISDSKRNILIMYGCVFIIFAQVLINIGVNINILPNKGMTLPFISYGGSAIVGMGILMGIILCLTKDIHRVRSPYKKIFSPF